MNRDSALFLLIGLLAGFLGGYIAHEEMSARQPQRLIHSEATAGAPRSAQPSPFAGGDSPEPAASGAPPVAGAPMARIQELRKRLEQQPNDQDALLELANLNFDIQNWARAKELYEKLIALRPGDADVKTDLGICLRALGAFDEALAQFRAAQKISPDHWQARFNEIVVLALDQNDLAAAESRFKELEALAPGNAEVARLGEEIRKRRTASPAG